MREECFAGGQAALKSRPVDERDDEIQRRRARVGEITMNNELLLEGYHRLEVRAANDDGSSSVSLLTTLSIAAE